MGCFIVYILPGWILEAFSGQLGMQRWWGGGKALRQLEASLEVYDETGRVTCRTERMLILPLDIRFGGGASERVGVSPRRRF